MAGGQRAAYAALIGGVGIVGVVIGGVALAAGQAAAPKPDGQLRSELSLGGRTAVLIYAPDIKASARADGRVRIGRLETAGALRVGTLDIAGPAAPPRPVSPDARPPAAAAPPTAVYELWLETTSDSWQLHVTTAGAEVGQIALARETSAPAAPTLVASLVPEDSALARLVLRWGDQQASADVQFINPQRRRLEENRAPNLTINRTHDEDTSVLSRARLLAQRNETALVLPKGQRVAVSFQRTFARGERTDGGGQPTRGLGVEGSDFARLMQTPAGQVVMLTESSVPRLRTEVALRFGKTQISTGNQVPGFPGSYGLWLKKVGAGWRLVFNHEPDAWGSQHDPKFDAAEIPLTYSGGHGAARPFAIAIVPGGRDRGRLRIIWGPYEWTADFVTN
jgi:hypothetical protein